MCRGPPPGPAPSLSSLLPPAAPSALPWQLNKQTRRTWGRGGGRDAGGAQRSVTPARQLAGRSRADAGGGGGSGPGVGLWVRGAGPVAARPGRSVSPRAASWVRSSRSRRPVGAKGDGNAPPTPVPGRACRAVCALEKSAIIRVTPSARVPLIRTQDRGSRARAPVRAFGLALHGSSRALLPDGGGGTEKRRVPSAAWLGPGA